MHSSFCEWKGRATYFDLRAPATSASGTNASDGKDGGEKGKEGVREQVRNRVWCYDTPTKGFEAIKGYLSFYAGPWECFVDGEMV